MAMSAEIQAKKMAWKAEFQKLDPMTRTLFVSMWPNLATDKTTNWEKIIAVDALAQNAFNWLRNRNLAAVCGRCGGTGHYSYNPIDQTMCYGCRGLKVVWPRITYRLINEVRQLNGLTPTKEADIMTDVSITGHRPASFPFGYNDTDPWCLAIRAQARKDVIALYSEGMRKLWGGMAQGWDQWVFIEAIRLIQEGTCPELKLVACVPMLFQFAKWAPSGKKLWYTILRECHEIRVQVAPREWAVYTLEEMTVAIQKMKDGHRAWQDDHIQRNPHLHIKVTEYPEVQNAGALLNERNRYMVDHVQKVYACYKGGTGGTANCIDYAKRMSVEIVHFDPMTVRPAPQPTPAPTRTTATVSQDAKPIQPAWVPI